MLAGVEYEYIAFRKVPGVTQGDLGIVDGNIHKEKTGNQATDNYTTNCQPVAYRYTTFQFVSLILSDCPIFITPDIRLEYL